VNDPICLVTGATGSVGPCIVEALRYAGYHIRTLSLDVPQKTQPSNDIDELIGDVTDPEVVAAATQGVEVVVHLAALLHVTNPPTTLDKKYEQINIGGTAVVVDAAIKAGVKRVVLASTIAVYGPSGGRILDEDSITCPDTLYGKTKLEAEKIVLSAKGMGRQPIGTVLRFGAIYGSRIKGNYQRLVYALSHGRFIPVGNGSNRRTLVYIKDVTRAIVLAIQHPGAAGKIFNVTDGQFHTVKEINLAICTALGRKPPALFIPVFPVRFVVGVLENVAGFIGIKLPITRATIDKYIEDVAVESQTIQTELGFLPYYNLNSGWRETIQEMQRVGEL
jgi:UDP-glucose 4-epimerase